MNWTCKKCGTKVEGVFDACWKCGISIDGIQHEKFSREVDAAGQSSVSEAAIAGRAESTYSFSYIEVLSKYVVFDGRAPRAEFWMFILINIVIGLGLSLVDGMAGTVTESGHGVLSCIFSFAVWLPSLAVTVRRLHDTGRSGVWLLICVVPFLGAILLLVFIAQDGDPTDNQYGPSQRTAKAPTRQSGRREQRRRRKRRRQ